MKRKLYIVLITLSIFVSFGFRGCGAVENFILSLFHYHATGVFTPFEDGESEYYSIAVGEGGKIYTREGRPPAPWIEAQSGVTQNLQSVVCLKSIDSTISYAVGDQGTVLRSTDKGYTWQNISPTNPNFQNLNGLDIIPENLGWTNIIAVGDGGKVIRSNYNGGNWTWDDISVNTSKKLNSVAIVVHDVFVVVGDSGTIYRTLDGGTTWENRSSFVPSSVSLKKVVTPLYNSYCAVGSDGKIYTSNDYGYSWSSRNSGTTATLRDIFFSSPDSGVVVGDMGTVRITTDAGLTWFEDSYLSGLTNKNIISVARVDDNTVSSVTRSGTPGEAGFGGADTTFFLAVSSEPFVGIEEDKNNVPTKFSLGQNYPNPFNPSTKIIYSVPEYGLVTLKVYDVLGNEIETLINEEKERGVYSANFIASQLSSGIYFCRMKAGSFVETKKMILIK